MQVNFKKMSGAGNDFVVIDNRAGLIAEQGRNELIARWCRRRLDIGADGVLMVEPPAGGGDAHFRMRYYNSDGGEAESCGNGARCIARFAHLIGAAPGKMTFETKAGIYHAEIGKDDVTVNLADPCDLRRAISVSIPDLFEGEVDFINTGVPHVVVFVDDLEITPVVELGQELRYHNAFAPAGTNVNFIQKRGDGTLAIRTYERGVEDETLACGTGSVAAALIANLNDYGVSPIPVYTRGGPVLTIHFECDGGCFYNIRLQGEARVVFDGTVEI